MLRWLVRLVCVPPPTDAGDTLVEVLYSNAAGPLRPGLSLLVHTLPDQDGQPAGSEAANPASTVA